MDGLTTLIPLILIIAVFYFFMIRPENKNKKKAAEMRAALKVGDVITIEYFKRTMKVQVLSVQENVKACDADKMYQIIDIVENGE